MEGVWELGVGTSFIEFLLSIFIWVFGLSYVGSFFVFNILGVFGLLAFESSLSYITREKNKFLKILATTIVFLPSVSFWSSAIGKDSISFMAVGFALWSSLFLKSRIMFMLFSIFLMLLIRPHISLIMLMALAAALIYDPVFPKKWKVALGGLMVLGFILLTPFVIDYAGYVDRINIDDLLVFVETRQGFNVDGGGGIDISNIGIIEKLLTYMFRPSILDVSNIYFAAAAFDNLLIFGIFLWGLLSVFKKNKVEIGSDTIFMWVYVVIIWVLLAMTTSNMGIALRQKWMFAPMLIYLMISLIGNRKNF